MYASWAASTEWQVKVFFASSMGFKAYKDKDFGTSIAWDGLGLEHFEHQFLNGGEPIAVTKDTDDPELDTALTAYNPDAVVVYGYTQAFQKRATAWANQHAKKVFFIADSERMHRRVWYVELAKWFVLRRYFHRIDHFLTVGNANEAYYEWYGAHPRQFTRLGFLSMWRCMKKPTPNVLTCVSNAAKPSNYTTPIYFAPS